MSAETNCQKNRETILNRAKEYYNDNNEVLKERTSTENYLKKKKM